MVSNKREGTGGDSSQEEMVPMGRIAVRHDLDWEAKDNREVAQAL